MPGLLGSLTVSFKADLSDLTSGVAKAKEAIASVSSTASSSSGGMLSSFKNAASGVLDFGAKLGQTVFGVKTLADSAIGLASAFLEPNASMEQTTVGFETLLGKGKKTQDFMNQLQQFAASTPFEFPELATNAQHMLAFGFSARDVLPQLTNIGDAMSAMGKGSADIDRVVTVFGQMKAAGKANAGDMMQLASQGIPAWKFLADAMHKTIPEVQDLSSKGLIPANVAIDALSNGMHKMFGGGMAAQANTFNGLMSTLQDNVGSAMRSFTGPLFDMAKSGLTQLGNLVSSPQFQQFAVTLGQMVGTGLTLLIQGITNVVQVGASLVAFFQQNQPAAIALGIVLGILGTILLGLALQSIVAFLATVPALVGGFIAWATAAGAAALATLAAALPFILVAAGIVAVVAIIVLAIQHWGDIVKFFQGIWANFTSWLGSTTKAAGDFFTGVWNNIVNGLKAAWNAIVNVVQIAIKILILIIFGPIIAIANLFIWLYQHNTYFQKLCDAIVNFFKAAISWLQGAWKNVIAWLTGVWNNVATFASTVWGKITSTIQQWMSTAISWLQGIWNTVSGWLQAQWNKIAGFASSAWQAVSTVFSNIWNTYIAGPLSDLWNRITKWFGDLASQFLNAGANFINMLVQGITGGAGKIWDAVVGIAQNIWKALGFHSPPEAGPAQDSDRWMPNLVDMLSTGLVSGVPKMRAAVASVAQPLTDLRGDSYSNVAGSAAVIAASASSGGASTSLGNEYHFHIEVGGEEVMHRVMQEADSRVRAKFGPRGRG